MTARASSFAVGLFAFAFFSPRSAQVGGPTNIVDPPSQKSTDKDRFRSKYSDDSLGKKYDELTREQKDIFRANYPNLGSNDEPPYPAEGMNKMFEEFRDFEGVPAGVLELTVQIDKDGVAQSVRVLRSHNRGLSRAVAQALMNVKYKPARCDGQPCPMDYKFTIAFQLPK